jgi:hypothetical protein
MFRSHRKFHGSVENGRAKGDIALYQPSNLSLRGSCALPHSFGSFNGYVVAHWSRVTVLERGPQLLPRKDKDVAYALLEFLHLDCVDVRLNVQVAQMQGSSGGSVGVTLATSAGT